MSDEFITLINAETKARHYFEAAVTKEEIKERSTAASDAVRACLTSKVVPDIEVFTMNMTRPKIGWKGITV